MRKLCPNYDFEDGLETVLEVPIPDEDFTDLTKNVNKNGASPWHSMKSWIKPQIIGNGKSSSSPPSFEAAAYGGKTTEIQLLLGVVGAPLIPLPLKSDHILHSLKPNIRDHPIEASMAKYIIEQYLGAVGGEKALNSIDSLCVVGKVRMAASEFSSGDGEYGGNREVKGKNLRNGGGEMGGFVLWQKRPELWCLELVLSGCKISAGSDGKVAWRQTPWHHSHASRGPPRPLRRSLQGLDPLATANLFSDSVCIGEKEVNNEDCFILKLEADPSALKARSSSNVEIIRHTVWGYFSQKTGLLMQLDDSHMLGIKHPGSNDSVIWETTMESFIEDYKEVDGINIAHKGKTLVSLFRFGECPEKHSRTRMEEIWEIEEMDFNIKGLSMDCFLPPGDLKKEDEEEHESTNRKDVDEQITSSLSRKKPAFIIRAAPLNVNPAKVVAVDAYEN